MIVPLLIVVCCCAAVSSKSSTSSRSDASIPPRPDTPFDRALLYAVGARLSPEETVAYVASRVAPGRTDPALMNRVASDCSARLAQPSFKRKCGCRG